MKPTTKIVLTLIAAIALLAYVTHYIHRATS